jgi:hypothetical protein
VVNFLRLHLAPTRDRHRKEEINQGFLYEVDIAEGSLFRGGCSVCLCIRECSRRTFTSMLNGGRDPASLRMKFTLPEIFHLLRDESRFS